MRKLFVSSLAVLSFAAICASAEAQYGYPPAADPAYPSAQPAPQPQYPAAPAAQPAAPAPQAGGMKETSGFLGPRLNFDFSNLTAEFGTMIVTEIEGGVWIKNKVQIFLGFGTAVYGLRVQHEDMDDPDVQRYGNLLFHLGARFHVTDPSPGRAYLYLGLDTAFVAGICKAESGGEEDDDSEDIMKEAIDRVGFGPLLGVEFLVSDNFGIGAETGLRLFVNNLKELDPENADEYDSHREAYLEVPFALRLMYHF